MRRADGDVRKLAGCGIRIDRAVAEHKDAILEAHEEHARNDGGIRLRLDDFEGGTDGVGRGVHSAGNHAVGVADLNHHRTEVGRVLHTLLRLLQRKALALAHFVILLGIGIETGGGCGLDNRGILQPEAKLLDLSWMASVSPSRMISAIPRSHRDSAARRIRSSSPSGRTMRIRCF